MKELKDGRIFLGFIRKDTPIIVEKEITLHEIAMASNILGLELHIGLIDPNPNYKSIKSMVAQMISDFRAKKPIRVRWP